VLLVLLVLLVLVLLVLLLQLLLLLLLHPVPARALAVPKEAQPAAAATAAWILGAVPRLGTCGSGAAPRVRARRRAWRWPPASQQLKCAGAGAAGRAQAGHRQGAAAHRPPRGRWAARRLAAPCPGRAWG
jgi:hypothetical protein